MLEKILLATDGSNHAIKAANIALEFAQKNGAAVEIMYIFPIIFHDPTEEYPMPQTNLKELAQKVIEKTAVEFIEKGVPFTTRIETGEPAERICAAAESENISLIIMGSRGQTGLSRFLMGSVSGRVVKHARCSVLVVR